MVLLKSRWEIARLALLAGALLTLLAPDTGAWSGIALLALASSLALGWVQRRYGPDSRTPDRVVIAAVFVVALVCLASRIWAALD